MTTSADNEQVSFWRGEFGNAYTTRNTPTEELFASRCDMWTRIMDNLSSQPPQNILEVGANLGTNLRALKTMTDAELFAVEPNESARNILVNDHIVAENNAHNAFAGNLPFSDESVDMVFTSGVLIHIHPDDLLPACQEIHRVSSRYIVCIEYFSDKPESVTYGNQEDRLFKRDFGSFWLDNFPELKLLDYGFEWKRTTGLDNLTWWVFEKHS